MDNEMKQLINQINDIFGMKKREIVEFILQVTSI